MACKRKIFLTKIKIFLFHLPCFGKMYYDVKNTSWNEVSRNLDGDNELIHTLYLQLYEKLFRVAYRMMEMCIRDSLIGAYQRMSGDYRNMVPTR